MKFYVKAMKMPHRTGIIGVLGLVGTAVLFAGCSGPSSVSTTSTPAISAAATTASSAATSATLTPSASTSATLTPSATTSATLTPSAGGLASGTTTQQTHSASDQPGADGACGALHGAGTQYLQGQLYVASGTIGCDEANAILNGYLTGPVEGSGHMGNFKGFECGRDNRPSAEVKAECEKDGIRLEVR